MKYTVRVDIRASRAKVVHYFKNREAFSQWQHGLISMEHLRGVPGENDAQTQLHFRHGKRDVEMTETILRNNLPESFDAYYEARNAQNWVRNEFAVVDDATTQWVLHSEFKCRGVLRAMALFFPGLFRKATLKSMNLFKNMAEESLS